MLIKKGPTSYYKHFNTFFLHFYLTSWHLKWSLLNYKMRSWEDAIHNVMSIMRTNTSILWITLEWSILIKAGGYSVAVGVQHPINFCLTSDCLRQACYRATWRAHLPNIWSVRKLPKWAWNGRLKSLIYKNSVTHLKKLNFTV